MLTHYIALGQVDSIEYNLDNPRVVDGVYQVDFRMRRLTDWKKTAFQKTTNLFTFDSYFLPADISKLKPIPSNIADCNGTANVSIAPIVEWSSSSAEGACDGMIDPVYGSMYGILSFKNANNSYANHVHLAVSTILLAPISFPNTEDYIKIGTLKWALADGAFGEVGLKFSSNGKIAAMHDAPKALNIRFTGSGITDIGGGGQLPDPPVFADAIDDKICGETPFSTVTSNNYAVTGLPANADTCIWYLTYTPKTGTHVTPGDAKITSVPPKGVSGITVDWYVKNTYYINVYAHNAQGNSDTISQKVTVEETPKLTTTPVFVCAPNKADLSTAITNFSSFTSFKYYTDDACTTVVANPNDVATGVYHIVGFTAGGCTDTASVNVNINSGVLSLNVQNSLKYCSGGNVDLYDAIVNPVSGAAYEYAQNGNPFAALNSGTLVTGSTDPGTEYTIRISAAAAGCGSASATVNVIETLIAPALADGSASHCSGGQIDLSTVFSGPYTYEYADNNTFTPLLGSSLVSGTTGGKPYYVRYADASKCALGTMATMTVKQLDAAPSFDFPSVLSYCAGGSGALGAAIPAVPAGVSYEYSTDGTFGTGVSALVAGTMEPAGTYYIRLSSSMSCTSKSDTVSIQQLPSAPTFDFPSVLSYCAGGYGALGAAIPSVPSGVSYEYSTDGTFATGVSALVAGTMEPAGTYYIRLSSSMSCSSKSDTVAVQQLPSSPSFDFPSVLSYCAGGSGALGAAIPAIPSGVSYEYSTDGTFAAGGTVLAVDTKVSAGTYYIRLAEGMNCAGKTDTVTVKELPSAPVLANDDLSHCAGGKVDLASGLDGSYVYEYSYNNSFSPLLSSSLVAARTDGKPYYVRYAESSGCTAAGGVATITVTETANAPALADGTAKHCATGHIDIANGLDDSYSYEYADNNIFSPLLASSLVQGTPGGTPYYIRYAESSKCATGAFATITVTETAVPSFDFPAVLSYCTDGALLGAAIPATPSGVSYEYSTDGTFAAGGTVLAADTKVSVGTYYIRLAEGMKCAGKTDTVQVSLIADCNLIVEAGSAYGSVCSQGGALLRVTRVSGGVAPYTYQWYEEGQESVILGNTKDLALGAPLAVKYVVKVTDNANNSATATVTIVSDGTRTAPVASAGSDMTVLKNTHTVLLGSASGGTAAYDWHWSPADKLSVLADSAVQYPQTADLLASQEYTLYVVDAQGCMSRPDAVNVNVDEVNGLEVEIIPATATICAGNSQALKTVVTGNTGGGTLSYSWTPADLVSGAILPNPDFLSADPGTYILTVAVVNGVYQATAKTTITVTSDEAPEVEFNDDIYCKGDTLWVYDGNMNVLSDNYRWFIDGVEKQNGSNMFYVFDTEGTFDVKVIGEVTGGCISDTAYKTVTISPVPTLAWNVKPAVAVMAGATFSGSVTVSSGTPAYVYHWVSPAVPEFVTSNGNFIVNGATGSAYDFEVYATDANTCRTNTLKETTLVNPAGVLSVDVQSRHGDVMCQNGMAFLDVSVAAGVAPYRYEWYIKDQPDNILRSIVKNSDRDTFLIASAVAAKYMVRVLDANSYAGIDSVVMTKSSDIAPVVEAGPDLTIISGGKTVLLGSATQGTGGYAWHWSPADKLDAADECTKQNPLTASLNALQKYKVYVTDDKNCVSPVDSTTVKIDPNGFVLGITPQTAVMCMGGSQVIKTTVTPKSNVSSAAVYKWIPTSGLSVTDKDASLFTPSASGDYTFVVTLTDGAKVAAVRTDIKVKANITPVFSLQKTGDCQKDTVKVVYAAGSTKATEYEWKVNNVVMAYTGEQLVLTNSGVNVVEVTGKNSECSSISQAITVNVNAAPEINDLAVVDSCGQAVVEVSASGATQPYVWTITPSAGGQDPVNSDRYIIDANGTYQVKVTADNGTCKANKEIAATVHERPELNAWKVAPADCAAGEPIYAQVLATKGAPAYVYHWLQPTAASGDSYTIAAAKFANYTFEVYAEDAMHCLSDTLKAPVKVEDGVMEVKITSVYGDVVCKGGAAMLVAKAEGAATPCTFKWYEKNTPGTVIRSANQAGGVLDTLWVNPASDTEYVVDVTDATVPVLKGADTILLKINNTWQAPVVSAGPDMTVVANSATVLLGQVTTAGTPDYQWHWGPVAQLATAADTGYQYPKTARLTARQQYQVYVVDANRCVSKRDVAEVNVDPNAFCVEIIPQDPAICRSNSVVLESQITCGSVNPQTAVYAWSPLGGLQGKTDTALVTFGPTTGDGEYMYAVSVTDNGRTAAARTKVTVRNADAPVLALSGNSNCKTDTLSVVNSGEPETSFVWNVDGLTVLSGAGKDKLPLDFTGTHRVEVYALAANGCQSDIETRDMKLGEIPPVFIVENHFADYRDSVFELHVVNDPTLMNGDFTYAWTSTPTAKINGATDELTMKSAAMDDDVEYVFTATSTISAACKATDTVRAYIIPDAPKVDIDQDTDTKEMVITWLPFTKADACRIMANKWDGYGVLSSYSEKALLPLASVTDYRFDISRDTLEFFYLQASRYVSDLGQRYYSHTSDTVGYFRQLVRGDALTGKTKYNYIVYPFDMSAKGVVAEKDLGELLGKGANGKYIVANVASLNFENQAWQVATYTSIMNKWSGSKFNLIPGSVYRVVISTKEVKDLITYGKLPQAYSCDIRFKLQGKTGYNYIMSPLSFIDKNRRSLIGDQIPDIANVGCFDFVNQSFSIATYNAIMRRWNPTVSNDKLLVNPWTPLRVVVNKDVWNWNK